MIQKAALLVILAFSGSVHAAQHDIQGGSMPQRLPAQESILGGRCSIQDARRDLLSRFEMMTATERPEGVTSAEEYARSMLDCRVDSCRMLSDWKLGKACECSPKAAEVPCRSGATSGFCTEMGACQTRCHQTTHECVETLGVPAESESEEASQKVIGECGYSPRPDGTPCKQGVCSQGECYRAVIQPSVGNSCSGTELPQSRQKCVYKPGTSLTDGRCAYAPYQNGTSCETLTDAQDRVWASSACFDGNCVSIAELRKRCKQSEYYKDIPLMINPCYEEWGTLSSYGDCRFKARPVGSSCGEGKSCSASAECVPPTR